MSPRDDGLKGEGCSTQATNTIEGFAIVLCDLKTLLETGSIGEPGTRQSGADRSRVGGEEIAAGKSPHCRYAAESLGFFPACVHTVILKRRRDWMDLAGALYKVPSMPLPQFHPAVQAWFANTFPEGATPAQLDAWPAIAQRPACTDRRADRIGQDAGGVSRRHRLAGARRRAGGLQDVTRVVYVSPLKALSNDIQRNLEAPLAGISAELLKSAQMRRKSARRCAPAIPRRAERAAMRRRPPHILVTTPESLYLLLTSASGREMLATVRTVIVDEIHAVAQTKRGAHLSLTLERLAANAAQPDAADRPVRDAEAHRRSREVPGG